MDRFWKLWTDSNSKLKNYGRILWTDFRNYGRISEIMDRLELWTDFMDGFSKLFYGRILWTDKKPTHWLFLICCAFN